MSIFRTVTSYRKQLYQKYNKRGNYYKFGLSDDSWPQVAGTFSEWSRGKYKMIMGKIDFRVKTWRFECFEV